MSKENPKPKQYYTVKIEATAPVFLTYKILAEDEEQALEMIKSSTPVDVKTDHSRVKKHKATVYLSGTTLVKLTKNIR